jgi:hypothetical protein
MKICKFRRAGHASAVALAVFAGAPFVFAQAEDQAAARSLFDDARQLAKEGHYAAACPKFDAASKLYPSAGILLNLADCYERIGKTASAWTEFGEAASVAARTHRADDASEARRRQATLEPALTRLTIRVAHEAPGLVVQRDGSPVARAVWGTAIPIDPGSYQVHAEAAGYEPWTTSVSASTPGQTVAVDVPDLHASERPSTPASPPAAPLAQTTEAKTDGSKVVVVVPSSNVPGWTLVVVGAAVGLGAGALVIIEAGRSDDAPDRSTYNSAQTLWTVGIVGAIAGGVSLVGGVALLTFAHGDRSPSTAVRASPWLGPGTGGLRLAGAW